MDLQTNNNLLQAYRRVLRPMVRMLLGAGVRYEEFVNLARLVYVETAKTMAAETDPDVSSQQVAELAGVAPEATASLIEQHVEIVQKKLMMWTLAEILHVWSTDALYLGPYGLPLDIEFERETGRCMVDLANRVHPDLCPRKSLDALIDSGTVFESAPGYFRIRSRVLLIPGDLSEASLENLALTHERLGRTFLGNLSGDPQRRLIQRTVQVDKGLPEEMLTEYLEQVEKRTQKMLIELDDWIGGRLGARYYGQGKRLATGVSVFHYFDPLPPQTDIAPELRKSAPAAE
jgi:hypothetical protein